MADLTSLPTVAIENTDWRLSFSPSPSLVTADLSLNPLIWLIVLSGVFGAVWHASWNRENDWKQTLNAC